MDEQAKEQLIGLLLDDLSRLNKMAFGFRERSGESNDVLTQTINALRETKKDFEALIEKAASEGCKVEVVTEMKVKLVKD